jgi:hypothetical protein
MEQELINELIRLIGKMGGKALMKELIEEVDTDGNPKVWTPEELGNALNFVQWQNNYFSRSDVMAIIEILLEKYNLRPEELTSLWKTDRQERRS